MLSARHALLGALLGFLLALPTTAAAQPLISNVQVSETSPQVTINGTNFGATIGLAWLDFTVLNVTSWLPTRIVADLPPKVTGTYLVTITTQGGETAYAEAMVGAIGKLTAPAVGLATASAGYPSAPVTMIASTRNSLTSAEERQTFRWQADPVGNNSANPSGRLSLNFAAGTATPAPTGLSIGENGVVTFVLARRFRAW